MLRRFVLYPLIAFLLVGCGPKLVIDVQNTRYKNSLRDMDHLTLGLAFDHPLTLREIVHIAICRNLDIEVKRLDWNIQKEIATSQTLKMLPSLTVNGELSFRNNSTAGFQLDPKTNIVAGPIISTSKDVRRWNATFTWNALDFALAFFRALEEEDRIFIKFFEYARAKQNLIRDVFKAYWKAMAAKKVIAQSYDVLDLTQDFIGRYQDKTNKRYLSQLQGLKAEDQLLNIQLKLVNWENAYYEGKAELADLMGIPADTCFDLADVDLTAPPAIGEICELERDALMNRPELFGSDFEVKLAQNAVREALTQLYPGAELFKSYFDDRDRFLLHHHWIVVGARALWDLLSLPQKAFQAKAARVQVLTSYVSRLALTVGVLSQVHIAYLEYLDTLTLYEINRDIYLVREQLFNASQAEYRAGEFSYSEVLLAEANALESKIDMLTAYGNMQVALEQLNNSIGMPLRYHGLDYE